MSIKIKIKKILLLIIVCFSFLVIACKEKIEPHLEITCDTIEIIDNKITLEYADKIMLNVSYQPGDITENIDILEKDENNVILFEKPFITAINEGSAEFVISYTNEKGVEFKENLLVEVVPRSKKAVQRLVISSKNVVSSQGSFNITVNTFGAEDLGKIIYKSSDENIAVVTEDGVVYGVAAGVCEISATLESNPKLTDTIKLNVFDYSKVESVNGGRYSVSDADDYRILPYGVEYQKVTAYTSTPLEGIDADGYGGGTEIITPDKYYPQKISLLQVPSSKEVRITTWANLKNNRWTLTTVKGLINNYESSNPGWKVVAAINGDFFDINAKGNLPYQTTSSLVSNGEFYKTTASYMIGFRNDGSKNPLVGFKDIKKTDKMILAIYDSNNNIIKEFDIDNINKQPSDSETSVFFANYNSEKQIVPIRADSENLYVVEKAELALPNNSDDFYGKGTISTKENVELGIGAFAIATNNKEVLKYLNIGVKIRCQYEYVGDYSNINDICGCRPAFLINGEYEEGGTIKDRAPRTAIGVKADGTIVMMVIDGRQSKNNMYGADSREMASIMKYYGCVDAYNLDGGGSSTMVIRDGDRFVVTNSPSDGRERTDGNCILVVVKDAEYENEVTDITETQATINLSVKNDNGKDIKKLWISLDNKFYEVVNGKVTLNNLIHNSTYNYTVFYENSNGDLIETLSGYSFKTNKVNYKYLTTFLIEDDEFYEIIVKYLDEDECSSIGGAMVKIVAIKDGEEKVSNTFLKGSGTVKLKKEIIGEEIKSISLEYSYQLDYKNRISEVLENVKYIFVDKRTSK